MASGLLNHALEALRRNGVAGFVRRVPSWSVERARAYLDGRFDRRFGTDTSGLIELPDLEVVGQHKAEGIWYLPCSPSVVRQLMTHLSLDYQRYVLIDFGSGKGRVLLLTCRYPFKRIIGVEFAPELHRVAQRNIDVFPDVEKRCSDLQSICMDAVEFELPTEPLVCFFFSPFKPALLSRVLDRIEDSIRAAPRDVVLMFYGTNPESIAQFRRPNWTLTELHLKRDWVLSEQHRAFVSRRVQTT